jgi:hypothetical protein
VLLILSVVIVLLEAFDALIGICRDDVIHPGMPPHKQGLPLHHNNQQHSRALAFVGGVCMGTHTRGLDLEKCSAYCWSAIHQCTYVHTLLMIARAQQGRLCTRPRTSDEWC